MRTPFLFAAAALVLGASACTSQGSITAVADSGSSLAPGTTRTSSPGTTAKKVPGNPDFVAQADAICADVKRDLNRLPKPETKAEYEEVFDDMVAIVDGQLADLRELDPPDDAELWEQTLDGLSDTNARFKELVDDGKTLEEIGENGSYLDLRATNSANARKLGLEVCGSGQSADDSTSTSTTKPTTTTTVEGRGDPIPDDPGSGAFSAGDCSTIRSANAELYLATETAEAETAAQVIIGYTPPTDVRAAIEVMVDGPGIQFDDNGVTTAASKTIDAWLDSVCPS